MARAADQLHRTLCFFDPILLYCTLVLSSLDVTDADRNLHVHSLRRVNQMLPTELTETNIIQLCNGEAFQPSCTGSDVIMILSAQYGRMQFGRCVKDDPELKPLAERPGYIDCSADVLHLVSGHCSGLHVCSLRVTDQTFHSVTPPCIQSLKMYLEVSYMCVNVAAASRYCTVSVSSGAQHIVSDLTVTRQHHRSSSVVTTSSSSSRCGDESRPWTVDALTGQRIVVTLIDFTHNNHSQGRDSFPQSFNDDRRQCHVTYGDVIDRAARKNVSICGQDGGGLSRVYVSQSHRLQIVFRPPVTSDESRDQLRYRFLIHVEAIGCSDVLAPSDGAWVRRDGDDVTVGCYTSRQSWQLRCVDGRWTGTVGLCQDDNVLISDSGRETVPDKYPKAWSLSDASSNSKYELLMLVAVSCCGVALCLLIICVGVACLRRQSKHQRNGKLLTSATSTLDDCGNCKPMIINGAMLASGDTDEIRHQFQQLNPLPVV